MLRNKAVEVWVSSTWASAMAFGVDRRPLLFMLIPICHHGRIPEVAARTSQFKTNVLPWQELVTRSLHCVITRYTTSSSTTFGFLPRSRSLHRISTRYAMQPCFQALYEAIAPVKLARFLRKLSPAP